MRVVSVFSSNSLPKKWIVVNECQNIIHSFTFGLHIVSLKSFDHCNPHKWQAPFIKSVTDATHSLTALNAPTASEANSISANNVCKAHKE